MNKQYDFKSFDDVILHLLCSKQSNQLKDTSEVGYVHNQIKRNVNPKDIYICGYPTSEENERFFYDNIDYFRIDPFKLAELELETLLCLDNEILWRKYVQVKSPGKFQTSPLVRAKHFEQHGIDFDLTNGSMFYSKDYYSVKTKDYLRAPLFFNGKRLESDSFNQKAFLVGMSLLDDFFRANTYMVTMEMEKKIHISASPEEVYQLLSVRDGPVANVKKKPVIHWVSHRRTLANNKKAYLRGTESFEIDGIEITVNPDYLDELELIF